MSRSPRPVVIALIQMRCDAQPQKNLDAALARVRDAAARGARVICLPELFRSPYFCQEENHANFSLAEKVPGPSTDALAKVAAELGVVVVASLFELRTPGLYHNTAAVIDADGSIAGKYRKMHIPDDPLYYEKFYFTPGDLGFQAFATRHANVGTLICWDQWFPEAARLTAMRGAEIIFYPTAIGWHPSEKAQYGEAQANSWEMIQRSHAIANGCFVAAVNRIGFEAGPTGGLEFWGSSFIAAPNGEIVAKASRDREEVLIAEIDLGKIATQRTHWPFLRDRRVDAYGDLGRLYVDDAGAQSA